MTPTDFKAVAVGKTKVSVGWKAPTNPEGTIDKYEYTIEGAKQSLKTFPVFDASQTSYNFTIEELTPDTEYTVTVKTYNRPFEGEGGGSGPAASLKVKTVTSSGKFLLYRLKPFL